MASNHRPDDPDHADEQELQRLRDEPSGDFPPIPPQPVAYELPTAGLRWDDFEKLCQRLAQVEGGVRGARRYGRSGQKQHGIDIYGARADSRYRVWQCRQYTSLDDIDIASAVDDFVAGKWAGISTNFTFCTALMVADTAVEDDAVAARTRLQGCEPPIEFTLWDGAEISQMLTDHPREVRVFFGPHHYDLFFPDLSPGTTTAVAGSAMATAGALAQPVATQVKLVSLASTPAAIQRALECLRVGAPDQLLALLALVGEPPLPHRAEPVVTQSPALLDEWEPAAIEVLALLAERDGAWRAAASAWQRLGQRVRNTLPEKAVGAFVLAAVAAKLDGDPAEHDRLLNIARGMDPNAARVVLEDIHDESSAEERIAALRDLQSDDPAVEALIKSNLAIGQLLLPDLAGAERTLASVPDEMRDSTPVRGAQLSLDIQRARLAMLDQRPVNGSGLRTLREDALALRDELLSQRRFDESARLLMLAVDASGLLGERTLAARTLAGRRAEEVSTGAGAEVLAAAALRIGDWNAVVEIVDAVQQAPSLQRLRAAATIELGRAPDADEAIAYLDNVVLTESEGALEAAMLRLAAVITDGRSFPWSKPAADLAIAQGHERLAIIAKSFELASRHADYEGAYALLDRYVDHEWALAMKLRLAQRQGNRSVLRDAASAVLGIGPGQELRLECGRALARARAFDEAVLALAALAQEAQAPRGPRAEAFFLLVRILGLELDRWNEAARYHRQWSELFPTDTRANAFAPMVARRASRS